MINRHSITESKIGELDFFLKKIERSLSKIKTNDSINLGPLLKRCVALCRIAIMTNEDKSHVAYGLKLYSDVSLAIFERYLSRQQHVSVRIMDSWYKISSLSEDYPTVYSDWFFVFSICNLNRTTPKLNVLNEMDLHVISEIGNPFWKSVVRYLKGYMINDPKVVYEEIGTLRNLAQRGVGLEITNDGSKVREIEGGHELLATIWMPIMELYDCVFYNKEREFNSRLEDLLIRKKEYIMEREWQDDPRFWIDFHTLSCCADAFKKGINIKTESDYVPSWVYKGDFLS